MQNHENFTFVPNDHVSHSLMCRVLGIWTKSVSALCTSKRINKCSRYKTYNFGDPGEQLYGESGTYEGKLLQNNFGMVPKLIVKPADGTAGNFDGAQTAEGCAVPWDQWQPPQPGHAKRLDDFRNYWKNATPHIKSLTFSSGSRPQVLTNRLFKATIEFYENNGRIVTLNDMSYGGVKIGSMYFTVAIGSYMASSTLPSGSHVMAQWGVKWIVAQCTTMLEDAVTGSSQSKKLELSFDLSLAGIDNLIKDFGKHFIAVGFAPAFSKGTVKTSPAGTTLRYYAPQVIETEMPLTLVNPDMYNDGMEVARVGAMLPDSQLQEKHFDVVCDLAKEGFNVTWTAATKNGQSGYALNLIGRITCYIRSVESGIDTNSGFMVFFFAVSAESTQGEFFAQDYFVMMKQGCGNAIYSIYLHNSAVTSATPALAQDSEQWVSAAKEWFVNDVPDDNPVELTDGIFIPFNGAISSLDVSVEILGAPTPDANSTTLYVPHPIKSNFGNTVIELHHY